MLKIKIERANQTCELIASDNATVNMVLETAIDGLQKNLSNRESLLDALKERYNETGIYKEYLNRKVIDYPSSYGFGIIKGFKLHQQRIKND